MTTVDCRYPSHIRWEISLRHQIDPLFPFSAKTRRKIYKTRSLYENSGFQFKTEPATRAFVNAFTPLYTRFIERIAGTYHDIADALFVHPKHAYPYYALGVYAPDNTLLGGTIFSTRKTSLGVAYRVMPETAPVKTPISVSYVLELLLNTYALTHQYGRITHGTDQNKFGAGHAIGLADYKYRIGARPYLSPYEPYRHVSEKLAWNGTDRYVFLMPESGTRIQRALFLTKKDHAAIRMRYPVLFQEDAPAISLYGNASAPQSHQ